MGADDDYGILFYSNSTGDLNSITVTGVVTRLVST